MAYTNSPQFNTYKTEYVAFSELPNYRDSDYTKPRDGQIINMYWDFNSPKSKPRTLKKRPAILTSAWSLTKVSGSDDIRGSHFDATTNEMYWAVGNKVYSANSKVATTVRTVTTLNTSSGRVGFCDYLKSDNTRYVAFSDGTDLWLDNYAITTCTRVTDVDLPTPHQPYPVYLDGYLVLIDSSTGDIYNSVVDDPFSWVPGDFITAEMSSDHAIALVRLKNYIVVFGYNSLEMFYNAGIATGSPFQRNDSAFHSIGFLGGLAQAGESVFFVGQQKGENTAIYMLKDFSVTKISNEMAERLLQRTDVAGTNFNSTLRDDADSGHIISFDGHRFYCVDLYQSGSDSTTLVYDIDNNYWAEWRRGTTNTGIGFQATWNTFNGFCFVAVDNATSIAAISDLSYTDGVSINTAITASYITGPIDFGTKNKKVCNRLFLDCSQTNASGTQNVAVSWSDKDSATSTFTTARNINSASQAPFINRLGSFRTRTFKFTESSSSAFSIKGMYVDLNVQQT